MFGNVITRIVIGALRCAKLSKENKVACYNALIDNSRAVPFRDIIVNKAGQIFVKGRPIDFSEQAALRESATFLLHNKARQLVHDQMTFMAINVGVHKAETLDQVLFSKAAIWFQQQEDALYRLLAQEDDDELPALED
jgi:hypothetical protein